MNFDDYQKFTRTTAIYSDAQKRTPTALLYCALGLVGESGEVAEKLKKLIRNGGLQALDGLSVESRAALLKEVSDVLWYAARLADELGVSFSEIAEMNVEKLSSRKERGVLHGSGDNR